MKRGIQIMTLRDKIWDEVLDELRCTGRFKISDLDFHKSKRHTVRRVLREMEDYGWLRRTSERAATWRLGPKAEMHLNVSADHIKQARN